MKWDTKRRAWIPEITDTARGKFSVLILGVLCLVLLGAATQLDLTTQVKNVLPVGNGGSGTSSTLTGIVRGGSSYTASELSGDCTTSGSNVVTCQKDNGTTIPTNSAADQVLLTTSSATGAWVSIPNCPTGAVQYSTSTHTFACGSILSGNFADDEIPSGSVNGSNTTFTLAHTPSPSSSLMWFANGQKLEPGGADYTLATATVTTVTAPPSGTILRASYRY